jgi:hypothetical protein
VSDPTRDDAAHWGELQRLFAQFEHIREPERGPALEAA